MPRSTLYAYEAQKVHSNEQIRASDDSGGSAGCHSIRMTVKDIAFRANVIF
ncbi:hypothetical protein BLL52_1069 [Rhodoferax antarcticus ANT.BR]|uniref:Uncharacterized protein n=1 Tax=Rhodoferax antarcticus ANT.BR TaxID=1111071 RepID=A0A1Q8YIT8_9BURK|nr:hypothetical protein BLL52_1069 [Rhodoferax antarcticus ANT.BR]